MKQRLIGAGLALCCILLGVAAFLIYNGQDKTAPVIHAEKKSLTYREGYDYSELLTGVTAIDDKDGDLTDQIFIDRIVPLEDGQAMVYYGVMDKSRNVGHTSRKVTYIPEQEEAEEELSEESVEVAPEESVEEQSDELTAQQPEEPIPDGVRPAMALTTNEMTVAAGTAFDPMSVFWTAVDDVDDTSTLSRSVRLEGTYDTSVPGTYTLVYYVVDSDGNSSAGVPFTLIVQ